MINKPIFIGSGMGLAGALVSAYLFSQEPAAQHPVFNPAANPYGKGIYSNGIVESDQAEGQNINIYPEVAGPVTRVLVHEGQAVHQGDALLSIDDSVQRATAEQQQAAARAAQALLQELQRQPRPETLAVSEAQVSHAQAQLKSAQDSRDKLEHAFEADARSVSKDQLDGAVNAVQVADTNLTVVRRQYQLTRAGAWVYDIHNQEQQYQSLLQAAAASNALLAKYVLHAPADGVVMMVKAAAGSYVSTQGAYDSYTQSYAPLVVMARPQAHLGVRAYVDEILVHELPPAAKIKARMFIRGTNVQVPLVFEHIQPYVSPKIELSDAREERVDLRVLPIVFRFDNRPGLNLYPGQLVDVYIGGE